jgi:CRP-like cAMP-binding protein
MSTLASVRPWASAEFIRSFATRLVATPDEIATLQELFAAARPVPRRQDIVLEGRQSRSFYLVLDGLLIRYRITREGRRQVVNLVVPGDITGTPSCFFESALYSVRTLTNATIVPVSVETMSGLLDTQPHLAAKLFWLCSCDAALSAEHVVVVGQQCARGRIAHFLLELLFRLRAIGLADDNSFRMPFSQEVIGDALGLSLAYVNRELRNLAADGLVLIRRRTVVITDLAELSDVADFHQHYLKPLPADELFVPAFQPRGRARAAGASARSAAF